jgi:hypothetical protein
MNRDERRVSMIQMLLSAEYDKIDKENAKLKEDLAGANDETNARVVIEDIAHLFDEDEQGDDFDWESEIGGMVLENEKLKEENKKWREENTAIDDPLLHYERVQVHLNYLEEARVVSGDEASDLLSNYMDDNDLELNDDFEWVKKDKKKKATPLERKMKKKKKETPERDPFGWDNPSLDL